ncbi:Siroheme synthase [Bacteroidales bacterium Barb4]|nr:Siroheme synthase [Bacteroidales bacterium Barb4]
METKEMTRYPVHIVGAGPGDPDLLTVKAKRLLEEADVLFYDCLPAEHVLKAAPSAEVIYINKHPEEGEKKEDILEYVKKYHLDGKKVVRLKAGDALMFNGGDVEARILKEWGIPFELVPGVTAAAAAANLFAIPTTEIHKSNAIVNVIAYEINDDYAHIRDIAKLFKHGTTVALYMAFDNLKRIFEVFKEEGIREDIPVVIAAMVSLKNQDVAKATMNTVFEVIDQREMLSPFVFFIGEHIDIYK